MNEASENDCSVFLGRDAKSSSRALRVRRLAFACSFVRASLFLFFPRASHFQEGAKRVASKGSNFHFRTFFAVGLRTP